MNQFEKDRYAKQNVDKIVEAYARLTGKQMGCPQSFINGILDCLYGDQEEKPMRKPAGKIIQISEYYEVAK